MNAPMEGSVWMPMALSLIGMLGLTLWLAWSYRRRWLHVVANSDGLISRLNRAESELKRYGLMLDAMRILLDVQRRVNRYGDALLDGAEHEARADATLAKITPRLKAIDEARKKCGSNLSPDEPVGTFRDPVYIQRPNAKHDDWAFVSTIDELVGKVVEGR